ncbi:MAG: SDR family oxidoreductase [Chlorobi bacterium]|nr:SDR family oxidoreductase [Chlorobiota bacterium]
MGNTGIMLRDGALEGKHIIVTGGGSGLGKSMSEVFLRLGAKVLICSRDENKLRQAARELAETTGGTIIYKACDVRDYEAVKDTLTYGVEQLGYINGLVNNAAGNFVSPTERLSPRGFDVIIDIVLKGTKNMTLAAGKYWIEAGVRPVSVVNIVTTYAFTGSGYVVPSAAAKGGVLAMTRSLAVEWAKYGMRFNAVAPGPFPTKGAWDRLLPGHLKEKFDPAKRVPLGRVGEHIELANLVSYLLSDYSAYVNGEVIVIDGGEWLYGAGQFNAFEQITDEEWDVLEQLIRAKNRKA